MRNKITAAALSFAAIAATVVGVGQSSADVNFPEAGDRIQYVFVSNKPVNDGIFWYDAFSDDQSFPDPEKDSYTGVRFKDTFVGTDGVTYYRATKTFTSQSTNQIVGGYISADYENEGSNNYVRCAAYVNGEQYSWDSAVGRYATAYC
ncbi:hypothetical protein [Williamsia sp.]|jgi:hypothetical protein|uniref:hypothetical protein n=1 Tax=Williamsia sp. TaxID=1872085 RepID=UPI002F92BEA0